MQKPHVSKVASETQGENHRGRNAASPSFVRREALIMNNQITKFIKHHYRHFNAAALIDAAEGYKRHLDGGGKMMITLAGAMSTAELGLSLAEMIRQDKVQIISCTGANLEEDLFNLVAHDFYERVPHYRDLTPADEQDLLDRHMNRVTDTCIPEHGSDAAAREGDGRCLDTRRGRRQTLFSARIHVSGIARTARLRSIIRSM